MTQFIRRLVSQNKQRHVTRGAQGEVLFDLDLTYLTENIICMGLPATGSEKLYRNPIESIARFLEQQHSGKYKIFNLCNERQYDISHFDGACATFPFDDHGAPPLTLIVAFCASAKAWLLGGMEHVVAIHCKAGKGRTGLMSCCLLLHLGWQPSSEDAIAFYNARRTKDGKGLTNPSQRRYVHYYARWLRGETNDLEAPRTLKSVRLFHAPSRRPKLAVRFVQHALGPQLSAEATPAPFAQTAILEAARNAPEGAYREALCGFALLSDVRVDVGDDTTGALLCRVWLHARLEGAPTSRFELRHSKHASEVDVIEKGALPDGFTIVLVWDDDPPLSAAALAAAEEAAVAAEVAEREAEAEAVPRAVRMSFAVPAAIAPGSRAVLVSMSPAAGQPVPLS